MDKLIDETFEVLGQIEKVSSRNTKIELLHRLGHNEFAKFYFETIFNPFMTYGVVVGTEMLETVHPTKELAVLRDLRRQLVDRNISGNNARMAVLETCTTVEPMYNKWIRIMWNKDLRIGISTSSIDKVFQGLIPQFELQLAQAIAEENLNQTWIVQPKYDGLRLIITFDGDRVIAQSRNGKELFNIKHIIDELRPFIKERCVLDGELLAADWNQTASIARASVATRDAKQLKFYVFDWIPLDEWLARRSSTELVDRMFMLNNVPRDLKYTVRVPHESVKDTADAWKWAEEYRKQGFEGAVAKNLNAVYEFDRSANWLKLKFVETLDLEVVGSYVGTGKNALRLGGLIIKMQDGTNVNVGGGYQDVQRDEFWKKRNEMVGKIIEVKFQEKTKDGSLRFPVFIRVREDKNVASM